MALLTSFDSFYGMKGVSNFHCGQHIVYCKLSYGELLVC